MRLIIRPSVMGRLSWGRPDSPQRPLCGLCHGPLPAVPLIMWKDDGSALSLCNVCVEEAIEHKFVEP